MRAGQVRASLDTIGKGVPLHKIDLVVVLATPEEVLLAKENNEGFAGSQEEVDLERMVETGTTSFDYESGDVLEIIEGPLLWVDGTALMLKVAPKP